jgi:hypothetical protein
MNRETVNDTMAIEFSKLTTQMEKQFGDVPRFFAVACYYMARSMLMSDQSEQKTREFFGECIDIAVRNKEIEEQKNG